LLSKNILPVNEDNIIYQAAFKLKEFAQNPNLGVKIVLYKNIPIAAGMAGGSSDAAATLKSLIKLWHIKISPKKFYKLPVTLVKMFLIFYLPIFAN